jgi:nucleoside-diphosphate-sugar epimerase
MRVFVLGAGFTGMKVAALARERGAEVLLTTRKPELAASLRAQGYQVVSAATIVPDLLPKVGKGDHVVATHQADFATDATLSAWAKHAERVTRISSTAVYGEREGVVDETSPLARGESRAETQLAAETPWQNFASVLRCAGIYGRERGAHTRILAGTYAVPGDGSRYVSRIHVDDLAEIILAVNAPGEALVVADALPATHLEVATFICQKLGLPVPGSVPLESVHSTLRGNRRINAARTHTLLGKALKFPSYREGFAFLNAS